MLENEKQINAFAAGFAPENAVIGVTRGSIEQLTRDELQGVIGHEFSHILNGDMRLNIRLLGLLHGILFIYIAGRLLLYARNDRHVAFYALGLSIMGIGGIGLLCGRLIQSAVSRQREFLADASAVQFTRNPAGIAGALEKLADIGSRLNSPYAETTRHMFFGNALSLAWSGDWFATHPPLEQRIARIRGVKFAGVSRRSQTTSLDTGTMGFVGQSTQPLAAEQVVGQVGTVSPEHYAYAQGLLAQFPKTLRTHLREPEGAIATIYALFLDPFEPALRERQIKILNAAEPEAMVAQVLARNEDIKFLDTRLRLPLLDLAIPALRQWATEDLQKYLSGLEQLAEADGEWSLSEFVLFLVLQRRLETQHLPQREPSVQYTTLESIWDDSMQLLSALASAGDDKPDVIAYGFRCGVLKLSSTALQAIPEVPPTWTLDTLKQSLTHLRQAAPKLKQAIVNACSHTVLLDHEVTPQEAEILRAVAITLDCPLPPFLNGVRSPLGRKV